MDRGDALLVESGGWSDPSSNCDSMGHELCYVPNGPFLYGENNTPCVINAPFYITKFPITRKQFQEFVRQTDYSYSLFDIMEQLSPYSDCPATAISWMDAKVYARWLRSVTGEYYSLPTSEQWESAARGKNGDAYPWGNDQPTEDHGTFSLSSVRRQTEAVNSYPSNKSPYGCIGMSGNVREWCLDYVDNEDEMHVLMGGCCVDDVDNCRCYSRIFDGPSEKHVLYSGFRLIYLTDELYRKHMDSG